MNDSERGPLAAPLTPPAAPSMYQAAAPAPVPAAAATTAAIPAPAPAAARAPRRRPARATTTVLGAAFLSAILAAGGTAALVTGPLAAQAEPGPGRGPGGPDGRDRVECPGDHRPGPA